MTSLSPGRHGRGLGLGPGSSGRPAAVRAGVGSDAARDLVPARTAWTVALTPVVGALLLGVVFAIQQKWLYVVLREDYPVEWAQFSLCLIGCLVAGAAAVRLARDGQYAGAVLLLLVAVTCFGLAGEEISWGQRVFNLVEPSELASMNKQDELNLHNVEADGIAVDDLFKVFSFLMGAAGVGLALLTRGSRPVLSGRFWWVLSPPLFTVPGFAAMALYRPFVLIAPEAVMNPVAIFQEWVEFALYLSLVATLVCTFRRAARGCSQLDVTGSTARWALATEPPGSARFVLVAGTGVVLLTLVFAALTIHYGIVPGNVSALGG